MILVTEHESLESALEAFKTESKSVLVDAGRHNHFQPRQKRRRPHAKSCGGNRQRNRKQTGRR